MSLRRAFSFGGGRQSTAALVLAARHEIAVDVFVFANVGDDSENPETLEYIRNYSIPYAKANDIELVEVQRQFRDNRDPSLYQYLLEKKTADWVIPLRIEGRPANRKCTPDWKIRVIGRYLKSQRKWTTPYELLLGISWDESHRMRDPEVPDKEFGYFRRYPLIDKRLTAVDCIRLVKDAGLPQPPKSACWFCPFTDMKSWAKMRLNHPERFAKSAELEQSINERRINLGKDAMFLTSRMMPLEIAIPEGAEQLGMFDEDGDCTSGFCWT